ncbi:hypothetical protein L596_005994 [Steinernema carpocapsae]|uniref:N-terminal Ras-GEF domain-containing protein n=1 Tax=Steinernema carpocapsae TaxID=34508 RepID=A0A4U8V0T0_STECR|nr:hypothetical protein L596_005994 [Steinernema carpocapsae]
MPKKSSHYNVGEGRFNDGDPLRVQFASPLRAFRSSSCQTASRDIDDVDEDDLFRVHHYRRKTEGRASASFSMHHIESLRTQPMYLHSSASHHNSIARQSNVGVDVNSYHQNNYGTAMNRASEELREKMFLSKNVAMRNGQTDFDKNDIIFDDTGMILSGSMEALTQRLLPTRDYCPPRHYIFTLLLNLRTFISPADLMQKILQHCMFEQNANSENFRKESRMRIFDNVYLLCSEWAENVPLDFRSQQMQQRLKELLSLCAVESSCKQRADDLVAQLANQLHRVMRYEAALKSIHKKVEENPTQSEQLSGLITLGATQQPLLISSLTSS